MHLLAQLLDCPQVLLPEGGDCLALSSQLLAQTLGGPLVLLAGQAAKELLPESGHCPLLSSCLLPELLNL